MILYVNVDIGLLIVCDQKSHVVCCMTELKLHDTGFRKIGLVFKVLAGCRTYENGLFFQDTFCLNLFKTLLI